MYIACCNYGALLTFYEQLLVVPFQFWLSRDSKQSHSHSVLTAFMGKIDTYNGILKLFSNKLWNSIGLEHMPNIGTIFFYCKI